MAETFTRRINIYIDSGQAQKAYDLLVQKQDRLTKQIAEYTAKGKDIPDKLTKQLNTVNDALDRQSKKLSGELSPNLKDLSATYTKLNRELALMSKQDPGFEAKRKETIAAKAALDNYRVSLTGIREGFKEMLNTAKGVAFGVIVGNTVQAAVQKVSGIFTGALDGMAKLSDELADIEKTTNLSPDAVRALNTELRNIDTRTGTSELRTLAAEAGKLGKESIDDVKSFVEQANQIKVALGEDLGEDAILNIAKASKIFNESMLGLASGVNEIGQSSEASESFAVDFAFRMSGIARTANIAAGDVLGFGAALELNGQQVEASSTALQKFFIDFVKDTEKFGKSAGFANGELSKLLSEKGTNAAFIEFLKRLKEGSTSSQDLLTKLEDLGIDGARGASAFLALSNSIELVEEQQQLANAAIEKGSSITEEYNKRNFNFAAQLARISKEWGAMTNSTTVMDFMKSGADFTLAFLRALRQFPEAIQENSNLLIALATAYVIYNREIIAATLRTGYMTVAKMAESVAFKAQYYWLVVSSAATRAYALAKGVLTGQIALATAAQRIFNTAIKANPIGALVAVLAAAAGAFAIYMNSVRDAYRVQKMLSEVTLEAAKNTAEERSRMAALLLVARDENIAKEKRIAAIKELNRLSPEYLGGLTLENINTAEGTRLLDLYVAALERKALAQAFEQKRAELSKKLLEAENEQVKVNVMDFIKGGTNLGVAHMEAIKRQERTIQGIKNEMTALDELYKKKVQAGKVDIGTGQPTATADVTLIGAAPVDTGDKQAQEERIKNEEATNLFIRKLREELHLNHLEGNAREIQAVRYKYEKLRAEAKGNQEALRLLQRLESDELTGIITEQGKAFEGLAKSKLNITVDTEQQITDVMLTEKEKRELAAADFAQSWSTAIAQVRTDFEAAQGILNAAIGFIGTLFDSINQRENQELAEDKKRNDAKAQHLKKQLDSKRISQRQYDSAIERMNKEQDAKHREVARKQFERNKAIQIMQTTINTAAAIVSALGTSGNIYAGIALAAIAGATGAAQIAIIASSKPEQYEKGTEGWRAGIGGKKHSHSSKGNPIIDPETGATLGLVEQGEAFIPADSTAANQPVINWMLRNRGKTLNFNRSMENVQFANGTSSYPVSSGMASNGNTSDMSMTALLIEIQQMRSDLRNASNKEVVFKQYDYDKFQETQSIVYRRQL